MMNNVAGNRVAKPGARHAAALAETLAAALVLAVGMGFGRFSYTGMYPLMVQDGLLTVGAGSLAASANYAGYLVGALLVSRTAPARSDVLGQLGLAATVACLALLAPHAGPAFLIALRFVAGIASALAMVAASAWLFQVVGNSKGAPLLYSGVGIGILLSAELIAGGRSLGLSSGGLWLVLAIASAVLAAFPWRRMRAFERSAEPAGGNAASVTFSDSEVPGASTLISVYGLAGLGYIVTATYLPLFVQHALGAVSPIQVWAAFGLGAAPSCFVWHAVHLRLHTRRALALNLAVQACGVILPVMSRAPSAFLLSALLVGGTFMGTVTIAMPAARRIAERVRFNIFAAMTAAYGVGQVAGPLLSDLLYRRAQSFDLPLLAAGAVLALAAALAWRGARPEDR